MKNSAVFSQKAKRTLIGLLSLWSWKYQLNFLFGNSINLINFFWPHTFYTFKLICKFQGSGENESGKNKLSDCTLKKVTNGPIARVDHGRFNINEYQLYCKKFKPYLIFVFCFVVIVTCKKITDFTAGCRSMVWLVFPKTSFPCFFYISLKEDNYDPNKLI